MSNIVIPPKINVGFQNRKDTYTGKLAYVIYFDEKDKLHKELSWSGWRDEKIPNEIYENKPLEGFVLNKKVGGYKSGWDFRQTYARVYDPRGFEFEITVENLLWILENNNCIKGKGLEGEYIYGWSGADLLLVPISSPDYIEIKKKNEIRVNNDFIKGKDLIVGATYKSYNDSLCVYLGRFHYYDDGYFKDEEDADKDGYICEFDNADRKPQYGTDRPFYGYKDLGLHYYFAEIESDGSLYFSGYRWGTHWKSISKKFIECVDSTCHPNYQDLFQKRVETCSCYSVVDISKNVIEKTPYEDFVSYMMEVDSREHHPSSIVICGYKDNRLFEQYLHWNYEKEEWYVNKNNGYWYKNDYEYLYTYQDIYKALSPYRAFQYLKNGNFHRKVGI